MSDKKKQKEPKILKVIDKNENNYISKFPLSDLPLRCLIIGRSQVSGKSTLLTNILLNPNKEFYAKDFKGENIFIFSGSLGIDQKMEKIIKQLDIHNVFNSYDEKMVEAIYQLVEEDFMEQTSQGKKANHFLIIFDDIASSGAFTNKKHKMVNEIFSKGRHICLSCIILAQYYTTVSPSIRSQATLTMAFPQRASDLELIENDMNYGIDKKAFKKAFSKATVGNHDFFVVNFTNDPKYRYLDKYFDPIDFNESVPKALD